MSDGCAGSGTSPDTITCYTHDAPWDWGEDACALITGLRALGDALNKKETT